VTSVPCRSSAGSSSRKGSPLTKVPCIDLVSLMIIFRVGSSTRRTSACARLITADSKKPLFWSATKPLAAFLLLLPIGWVGVSGVSVIVRVKSEPLLEKLVNVGKAPGGTDASFDCEFGGGCGWRWRLALNMVSQLNPSSYLIEKKGSMKSSDFDSCFF
jgi:hypothetical protein